VFKKHTTKTHCQIPPTVNQPSKFYVQHQLITYPYLSFLLAVSLLSFILSSSASSVRRSALTFSRASVSSRSSSDSCLRSVFMRSISPALSFTVRLANASWRDKHWVRDLWGSSNVDERPLGLFKRGQETFGALQTWARDLWGSSNVGKRPFRVSNKELYCMACVYFLHKQVLETFGSMPLKHHIEVCKSI